MVFHISRSGLEEHAGLLRDLRALTDFHALVACNIACRQMAGSSVACFFACDRLFHRGLWEAVRCYRYGSGNKYLGSKVSC